MDEVIDRHTSEDLVLIPPSPPARSEVSLEMSSWWWARVVGRTVLSPNTRGAVPCEGQTRRCRGDWPAPGADLGDFVPRLSFQAHWVDPGVPPGRRGVRAPEGPGAETPSAPILPTGATRQLAPFQALGQEAQGLGRCVLHGPSNGRRTPPLQPGGSVAGRGLQGWGAVPAAGAAPFPPRLHGGRRR